MGQHTIEKIGGTSMSRFGEVMKNVIIGSRKGAELYNRAFVVSAYSGITNALLEDKKTGAPGVFGHILHDSKEWENALENVRTKMLEYNKSFEPIGLDVKKADAFVNERLDGIKSCLQYIRYLRTAGHSKPADYLPATREFLAAVGEAHSAFNSTMILKANGINARFIDLSGWMSTEVLTLDEAILNAFKDVDFTKEMPIVTGYGKPSWIPDGGQIPMVRDRFDRVTLRGHTLAAIIRVSSELIKDSAIDLEKYLADAFAERLVEAEEEAFIIGDGVDKPKGLLHQAKAGCETAAAGSVSIDDVLNLIFSVPEKHRRNGVLLMNDTTLLQLYKLCRAQGPNLWFGKTNDGKDDTFFGMRIARCAAMPDPVSGNTPILFGDFRKVFISNQGERGIRRLIELYALNNHVGYLIGERVDIQLSVPDAVKGLMVT